MKNSPSIRKKADYKWVIVVLSFLMVMVCLGFCSSPKSLFIAPITSSLGITRSALSLNDSCRFISTAVVNLFFGSLVARFGPKKLILAGFTALISSQLVYSFADNVFGFCLGGTLLGIGLSWTTTTMVGCVVNKWCKEKKGSIMGAILAANGIGGAIAIQILSPVIESGVFGYRTAYRIAALVLTAVGVLVLFFFRNKPAGEDLSAPVSKPKRVRRVSWDGLSFQDALKQPYFYLVALCIFFSGLSLQSVTGIAAAHMKDVGLDPVFVSSVLSLHSLALAGFKFITGFLYDKWGLRPTVTICSSTAVVVMLLLSLLTDSPTGKILALVYGVFSSLSLPLETIMLPIYAGDLFGQRSFDKVLGIFVSINTAGYAVGAPVINWFFDRFGNYSAGLIVCAGLMLFTTVTIQFVITAGHKHQKAETEARKENA